MASLTGRNRFRAVGGVATLGLLLAPLACDDAPGNALYGELAAARDRWAAAGPSVYAVTQHRSCFCAPPFEWTVVVENGIPSFIESAEGANGAADQRAREEAAFAASRSVEQLFDWIEARIPTAAKLDVTFDPDLGFPSRVDADPIAGAVDDEVVWELFDLVAVGACTEIGCSSGLELTLVPSADRFDAGDYEVVVTPDGAAPVACGFTVTIGGSCATSFCVQGGACVSARTSPDRVDVHLPALDGPLAVSVTIDGTEVASVSLTPEYERLQPNGPLCGPVCWFAQHDVALP